MPKPRIDPIRWQPPPSRPLPEPDLTATLHVVPLPGNAPEDVVADAEGNIWTGVDDGRIIRITPDGASTQVMVNTGGRPLGLAVARDGRLLICDSHRGDEPLSQRVLQGRSSRGTAHRLAVPA
jgi:streptogramin lyase